MSSNSGGVAAAGSAVAVPPAPSPAPADARDGSNGAVVPAAAPAPSQDEIPLAESLTRMDKEASALGGLFQQVLADMKVRTDEFPHSCWK